MNIERVGKRELEKISSLVDYFIISEMVDRYGLVEVDSPDSIG